MVEQLQRGLQESGHPPSTQPVGNYARIDLPRACYLGSYPSVNLTIPRARVTQLGLLSFLQTATSTEALKN